MSTKQLATFYAGGRFLGIEVTRVQEVIRYQEITRAPLARGEIRGLINLRGVIVMALDLRRRLGLPDDATELPMNVVVRAEDGLVSFLVDRIGDVVQVDEEQFEEPPETLRGTARDLLRGAYKLEGALLLELDADRALEAA